MQSSTFKLFLWCAVSHKNAPSCGMKLSLHQKMKLRSRLVSCSLVKTRSMRNDTVMFLWYTQADGWALLREVLSRSCDSGSTGQAGPGELCPPRPCAHFSCPIGDFARVRTLG